MESYIALLILTTPSESYFRCNRTTKSRLQKASNGKRLGSKAYMYIAVFNANRVHRNRTLFRV